MVTKGVIAPVTKPTEWVSQMVVTQKKDSDAIRICIDPKDVNEAIQREHYPMRIFEEVIARMPKAQYFTTLDASHRFWQIPLDHESALKTAFNTPYGRYYFMLRTVAVRYKVGSRDIPKSYGSDVQRLPM